MEKLILEVNDVSKRFSELTVLKSVSLAVSKAEVVTITGPSGAGKSTLLHILGTLDRPSEGEVRVGGELVTQLNDARLSAFRNRHIGFVFQFHHLLPEFTSIENVCIPAFIAGESREKAQQRAVGLLEKLGLGQRLHHKPSELSGGEQQRVAVARALINNPDVVLADEPSGNLDTNAANQLHQLFFDLRSSMQQTFVIVTHNPDLAAQADRTIHLTDGMVVE